MFDKKFPLTNKDILPGFYACAVFMVMGYFILSLPTDLNIEPAPRGVILKSILGMGIWLSFFVGLNNMLRHHYKTPPSYILYAIISAFCFTSTMCGTVSLLSAITFFIHYFWPLLLHSDSVTYMYSYIIPILSAFGGIVGLFSIMNFKTKEVV